MLSFQERIVRQQGKLFPILSELEDFLTKEKIEMREMRRGVQTERVSWRRLSWRERVVLFLGIGIPICFVLASQFAPPTFFLWPGLIVLYVALVIVVACAFVICSREKVRAPLFPVPVQPTSFAEVLQRKEATQGASAELSVQETKDESSLPHVPTEKEQEPALDTGKEGESHEIPQPRKDSVPVANKTRVEPARKKKR